MATESDKTSTGVIATIVVVGSFAMIAISAMVAAMVRAENAELERVRPTNADLETVAELDRKQLARLNAAPSWVSEPGGKVAISIATAMRLVVDEYQKDPQAASPPPPPGLVMNPTPTTEAAPGAVPGPGAAPASAAPTGAVPPGLVPANAAPASPAAPAPAAPSPAPASPAPVRPAVPSTTTPAAPTPAAPSATPPTPKPPSPVAPGAVPPPAPPSKAEPAAPAPVEEP